MLRQINKKIFFYLSIFILLTTLNNKELINFQLPNINQIDILGFDQNENNELSKNLEFLKSENLFFLNKEKIKKILDSNNLVESYHIFRKFPSTLVLTINKTSYLATTKKGNQFYLIGSNNKFIKTDNEYSKLPQIFGNFRIKEFIQIKKFIDESKFDYEAIKFLYFFPSGRWDIHTNSGIVIKLPKIKVKEKLNLVSSLLIDDKFKNLTLIDIRQKNQIVINE
tara:strand:- start:84 stop:755 length:672 start_codon:yes stop_codon:yes gene_type:complete